MHLFWEPPVGPCGKELTVAYVRKQGPQLYSPKKLNSSNKSVVLATQCSVTAQRGGVGWGWEEGSRRRGHKYTYSWFTLWYGRNQQNIVKQLSSNFKKVNLEALGSSNEPQSLLMRTESSWQPHISLVKFTAKNPSLPCQTSDLQNCELMSECCFKPLSFW